MASTTVPVDSSVIVAASASQYGNAPHHARCAPPTAAHATRRRVKQRPPEIARADRRPTGDFIRFYFFLLFSRFFFPSS
ncbi:hypothetical protein, partial [Kitasatospora albolonga]|uniref:hypothetical protein n=1 Tax=Kitasatospora albolonga TaxID=68173 RepID=UPI0031EC3C2B